MRRIVVYMVAIIAVIYIMTSITGNNYIYKALWYNYADVDDYKIFENREVKTESPKRWVKSSLYNSIQPSLEVREKLDSLETLALVVLRGDTLMYEEYAREFGPQDIFNSFSMAKSIVAMLTMVAVDEGLIKSIDDPVWKYLPEFKDGEKVKIRIRHLLTMTSGTDWNESYSSPFSITTRAYYGKDLDDLVKKVEVEDDPGSVWEYQSGDTQLLALILMNATGRSISDYAAEKLWKPLHAENHALWSLDTRDGIEKAYCCFNATARDFARIGYLMLNHGYYRGTQLLDSAHVNLLIKPVNVKDRDGEVVDYYGMQWWILPDREGVFYARGILGQYIIVVPEKNVVLVRLGKERGERVRHSFEEVYLLVDWILNNY